MVKAKKLNGPIAPAILLKNRNLSPSDKLVWLAVRDREGQNEKAWPSLNTIAADIGMSRSTVIRATAKLESLGWLKVDRSHEMSNRYECWIPIHTQCQNDTTQCQNDTGGGSVKMTPELTKVLEVNIEPILSSDDDPEDLAQFVERCRRSPQRHVNLIGEWADEVKPSLKTKAQWNAYLKRNLRAATALKVFSDHQMSVAMQMIYEIKNKSSFEPTMETLLKQLTK